MKEAESKFRSRKWIIASSSLVIVTIFAAFGLYKLAKDAGDVALILGSWAGSDGAILGLYSHFNVKEGNGRG